MRRPVSKSPFIVPASGLQRRSLPLAERVPWIVAKLHLPALGAELIVLTREQADCTGVKVEGSFKGGHNHQEWHVAAVCFVPQIVVERLGRLLSVSWQDG